MTEQPKSSSVDEQILLELKKMNRVITLSNGSKLESELAGFATTDERKMIWVLIDGETQPPEIAKRIGKTKRAVDMFLQVLEDANLIEKRKYGKPPKRYIDYVPAAWIELLRQEPAATLEETIAAKDEPLETDNDKGETKNV